MRIGLQSLRGGSSCPGVPLSQQTVYNLARGAGFSPEAARTMVAIAMRESGLNPSCVVTSVAGSTEASYGLWQINMNGSLGSSRMRQFGLSSPEQLLDPQVNAAAAFSLSGGSNFSPWHIDSDTATVNGQLVNLGYRTKYLTFLAGLSPALETGYSGEVDLTGSTTVDDLPTTETPPIDTGSSSSPLLLVGLGLLALWWFKN